MPRTLLPLLRGDQEERRYFDFFRSRTAPDLAGYFDANFWDHFVLQLSQAEPAVHHAVVALASLHEDFNDRTAYKVGSQQYSLSQYNKSLVSLSRYMSTGKERSVDKVMICCILFAAFESFRGDYEMAGQHLKCGLKILSSSRQDPLSSKFTNDDIVPVFIRLCVQFKSMIPTNFALDDLTTGAVSVPRRFSRLGEARDTIYTIMTLVFDFNAKVEVLILENGEIQSEKDAEMVLEQQAHHRSLLEQWQVVFDDFLSQLSRSMDCKDLSGAILLKILYSTLTIFLNLSFSFLQCQFDRFLPWFQNIVSLAKSLIKATEETRVSPEVHSLGLDMGIIAPLYFVATRCRDPLLRREAIHLLSSPRCEGPWDASIAAIVAGRVIAIEEEGLPQVKVAQDVPESSRIYEIMPREIDTAKSEAKLLFHQNAKTRGQPSTFEERLTWDGA